MALGAVLATQLTDRAVRVKGLYLGGLDVLLEPGTSGNRTGTPIESVHVTEAGPGGVSSMEFSIEDPGLEVGIAKGLEVRFHDIALDYPIFLGFVQNWSVQPGLGDQGRVLEVTAIGIEAVLDWAVTSVDLSWPAAYFGNDARMAEVVQQVVANAIGIGPIRVAKAPIFTQGTQATPLGGGTNTGFANFDALTIPAGTSVREAIRQLVAARTKLAPASGLTGAWLVTVDFTYGLRTWQDRSGILDPVQPDDYTTEVIVDAPGSAAVAEGLTYKVDAAAVPAAVLVIGTGVSLLVPAGDAAPGQVVPLADSTITTAEGAQAAGEAYLNSFRSGLRGSYARTDRVPVATVHAGSLVELTDARAGLVASLSRIMQIEKTYNPSNREDWRVTFGGLPPSGAALIRRLTRDTLS